MNFGEALEALKQGKKVARSGWNGKGMFVYYVPPAKYVSVTDVAVKEFGPTVPYRAYLAIRTVNREVVPWVISQSDALEEDWQIVE